MGTYQIAEEAHATTGQKCGPKILDRKAGKGRNFVLLRKGLGVIDGILIQQTRKLTCTDRRAPIGVDKSSAGTSVTPALPVFYTSGDLTGQIVNGPIHQRSIGHHNICVDSIRLLIDESDRVDGVRSNKRIRICQYTIASISIIGSQGGRSG